MDSDAVQSGREHIDVSREELMRRRETLARRLEDGYRRIDQAVATGTDVAAWESFWIDLLREYESICDQLQAA